MRGMKILPQLKVGTDEENCGGHPEKGWRQTAPTSFCVPLEAVLLSGLKSWIHACWQKCSKDWK